LPKEFFAILIALIICAFEVPPMWFLADKEPSKEIESKISSSISFEKV
jgi:hypothetical protein